MAQSFKDVPPGLAPKALRMKEAEAMGKFHFDALVAATPRPVPTSAKEFVQRRRAYVQEVCGRIPRTRWLSCWALSHLLATVTT